MAGGRPTRFTKKVAEEICQRIAEGESLYSITADDHMPARCTIYHWLGLPSYSQFLDQYKQARERQAETFIDQCIDIADATSHDTVIKTTKKGDEYEAPNHEWISRSRLRVDTRIKLAEKLAPKKYTPQKTIEHTGGPVLVEHSVTPAVQSKLDEIYGGNDAEQA